MHIGREEEHHAISVVGAQSVLDRSRRRRFARELASIVQRRSGRRLFARLAETKPIVCGSRAGGSDDEK